MSLSDEQGKEVLVTDDEPSVREVISIALEYAGYQPIQAADGKEALRLLHEGKKPQVILLDLMMPEMNGWELAAELAKDENFKSIPIVIVSAFSDRELPPNAKGTIRKPVDLDTLYKRVEEFCH